MSDEEIFKHTDDDGCELQVTEQEGRRTLVFFSLDPSDRERVGVEVDPARVNDLYAALGKWMAERLGYDVLLSAHAPGRDEVTFSGLVARVTEMERRQGVLSAQSGESVEELIKVNAQQSDRISNLNGAVNRLHRRLDALVTHEARLTRLEESDVSTVPDLSRIVGLHGARLDDLESTQRGAPGEFDEKEAAEELGEVIKGLAYLRGAVDSMHENLHRQASSIATSAQLSRNATHEALVGLLTEIRDRLPAPVLRCLDTAPDGSSLCELEQGHANRHARGTSSWPQRCGAPSPYDVDEECQSPAGHRRSDHRSGRKAWQPT